MNSAEPEWPSGLQCRACGTDGRGFEPKISTNARGYVHRYVDQKGLASILTSTQSAGVTPEVNLRITQARKHPGFETQGRCHHKFKTGVSVAPRKGLMSSKLKKKRLFEFFIKKSPFPSTVDKNKTSKVFF